MVKNKAAVALGKKRWENKSPEERAEAARELNEAQWGPGSEEKRKAQGARLAAARKAAREKRAKAK